VRSRIAALVTERYELRCCGAGSGTLERNRLAIVRAQQELSHALIALFGSPGSRQTAA
jgi:hypothetical protein